MRKLFLLNFCGVSAMFCGYNLVDDDAFPKKVATVASSPVRDARVDSELQQLRTSSHKNKNKNKNILKKAPNPKIGYEKHVTWQDSYVEEIRKSVQQQLQKCAGCARYIADESENTVALVKRSGDVFSGDDEIFMYRPCEVWGLKQKWKFSNGEKKVSNGEFLIFFRV